MSNILLFSAHTLIGLYFVFFGVWNIYHWFSILECLSRRDIPHPYLWLSVAIVWEILAGMLIILGIFVKIAAFSLVPFVFLSIWMFYDFWNHTGDKKKFSIVMLVSNLTIALGALCLLM
jgi:uncharacterized membrane protein YphA (DoxX/SURF4 family)